MLTWENIVEATALRAQGWTISAIARHLGHDRKTIKDYLDGKRTPGQRVKSTPDLFEEYAGYARIRLVDDPHLWATTLFDEVVALGYMGSYPSFTRGLRVRALRPHCEPCQASTGRDHTIIDHPPGSETQFDWLELPDPPTSWGWGDTAHMFVGALSHSSKWRAVLAESEDQPHMIECLDGVLRRLGGCTKAWRFDPDGNRVSPADRENHRHVRPGREVLRGRGRHLSVSAREPQRRGREGQPLVGATLVAHLGR